MARPKKDNAEYFSHDNNMRNDPKIKAIRRKYKNEGYAIWNMLLEVLTEAENFNVKIGRLHIELLAGDFDCEPEYLLDLIEFCISIELLNRDGEMIFSSGLKKRLAPVIENREKSKKAYLERLAKKEEFLPQKPIKSPVSTVETIPLIPILPDETTQSKVNESKVNIIEREGENSNFILIVNTEKIYDLKKYSAAHFQTTCDRLHMNLAEKYDERFNAFEDRVCGCSYPNTNEVVKHFNNFMNLPESKYQQEKLKLNGTKNTGSTSSFANGNIATATDSRQETVERAKQLLTRVQS